jgi:2,3-bisphosphoglycerate-independent phosphoglycerate mutase
VRAASRYVVCVPDGCADEPLAELGGRTPLEAAHTPTLWRLAQGGVVGRAEVIPPGMAPGSDVGNMAILGYDPRRHHTGRAPIEAAAMGLELGPDQVAFRCNLVTVDDAGTMLDYAGGHPSTAVAAEVVEALQRELGGDQVTFHAGVQYRHCVVVPRSWADATCVPPHDLTGGMVAVPQGPAAPLLVDLMEASRPVLAAHDVDATQIWLWGQGCQPTLPGFGELHGVSAGLVTAVDLVRGLGVLAGLEVHEVEGATGLLDTNWEGKRDAALHALADGADLFVIHVEATDECGHAGDVAGKVEGLERWDRRILQPLVTRLDDLGPWRILVVPDHATPCARRTHTSDPVPFLMVRSTLDGPGGRFTEAAVRSCPPVAGYHLLPRLLSR